LPAFQPASNASKAGESATKWPSLLQLSQNGGYRGGIDP